MNKPIIVDLFVEDSAHEEFFRAMVNRIARQERKAVTLQVRSARGGHGRVLREFALYQKCVLKRVGMPDVLFVAIDANCRPFNEARKDIETKVEMEFRGRTVVACPDPHIERWYLADPESFAQVVGTTPKIGKKKCERNFYKAILSKAIMDAGHPPTLGGIEFASELVNNMDFYRAGKTERSLNHFLDNAIAHIRSL